MSCQQLTDRLRHRLSVDLLSRLALLPVGSSSPAFEAAFALDGGAAAAASLAEVPTDVLILAVKRSGADAPLLVQEIGRRGATYALAVALLEYNDARAVPEVRGTPYKMVQLALREDAPLTLAQLTHLGSTSLRHVVLDRAGDLPAAVLASLIENVDDWGAYLLASSQAVPVELLPALAVKCPTVASALLQDPRTSPQALAVIAGRFSDRDWKWQASQVVKHGNVDHMLLPVPLLIYGADSTTWLAGFLDGRLGIRTPARQVAERIGGKFPGTLADLLATVAAITNPCDQVR